MDFNNFFQGWFLLGMSFSPPSIYKHPFAFVNYLSSLANDFVHAYSQNCSTKDMYRVIFVQDSSVIIDDPLIIIRTEVIYPHARLDLRLSMLFFSAAFVKWNIWFIYHFCLKYFVKTYKTKKILFTIIGVYLASKENGLVYNLRLCREINSFIYIVLYLWIFCFMYNTDLTVLYIYSI